MPWATMLYAAIFLAAIAVLVWTLSSRLTGQEEVMTLTVNDEAGAPVADALVSYGDAFYRSGDDGKVHLGLLGTTETIVVEHDGYTTVSGEFDAEHARTQVLTLQALPDGPAPESTGALAMTSNPSESEPGPGQAAASITTPATGTAESSTSAVVSPPEVAGTIRNIDGEPVNRGWVTDGTSFAFTDADGVFVFEAGAIQPGATLSVFGAGYHLMEVPAPMDGERMDLILEHQMIRGLYFNPNISNNQEDIDRFIEIANTTEVNAVVIDIKEEVVFYNTEVQLFHDAGIVNPVIDVPSLLQQFKDNDIYTIARHVVFKDSLIAEQFPELAVLDNQTGGLWRDMNGVAWVNPMDHTLWDANIELAYEAAMLGFDEIQYDYIRFPTDGDLSRVSYGLENTQANREAAIEGFLQRSYDRLIPTGARLSADVFGYTVVVEDDLGIGQNLDQLAPHLDYLSPMVYPSHWPEGSLAVDGHPNDFPYETIEISMGLAVNQLDGQRLKLRPWLQDFNYWIEGSRDYGDAEVRAQIDAVNDLGLSGWLIWDPNNWYHDGAYAPNTDEGPVTEPATPAVGTPVASVKTTRSTRRVA